MDMDLLVQLMLLEELLLKQVKMVEILIFISKETWIQIKTRLLVKNKQAFRKSTPKWKKDK